MEKKPVMQNPRILLFDCSEEIREELNNHRFSVKKATFGRDVKIEPHMGKDILIPLLMSLPRNIHEFDIFVVDMCGVDEAIAIQDLDYEVYGSYRLRVPYPQRCCYSSAITSSLVLLDAPPKAVYVIFAGACFTYSCEGLDLGKPQHVKTISGNTYDFLQQLTNNGISVIEKRGEIVKVIPSTPLYGLLNRFDGSFSYKAAFEHPTRYNSEIEEYVKSDEFVPLMQNKDAEIVSFICEDNGTIILVLPQTTKKKEILIDLLEDFFPSVLPDFFPESTKFFWVASGAYALPNQSEYESRKLAAKDEFERTIRGIDFEIEANYEKYRFLHDLLTGTGELLVAATVCWLKWLGFTNVVDVDKEESTLNEDIDVVEDSYVLIIEVKGVGGTSTDSECSQIEKHRRRVEKANRTKEVFAAYIVNHQRFLPPESRSNPPFTQQQKEYAENAERGLLTTYQLFLWFYAVNNGTLQKEDIKELLLVKGLVPLVPSRFRELGKIENYYQQKNASIFTLNDIDIKTGDHLLLVKGNEMKRAEIISIMVNDQIVGSAKKGKVGISTDTADGNGYIIYLEMDRS